MTEAAPTSTTAAITDQGEAAMRVQFTATERSEAWRAVQLLGRRLRNLGLPSLHGVAATYDSALVEYDPLGISGPDLRSLLQREAVAATTDPGTATAEGRHFHIPACYSPEHGPDLPFVAEVLGLTADEVCARHANHPHLVWSYGAPAAAPLMDGVGGRVPVPRRGSPRTRVAPGSLALAGQQSIIYTVPAPGGWQIIGRTPVRLLRARDEVCAYRAGDRISYFPIEADAWDQYADADLEDFRA